MEPDRLISERVTQPTCLFNLLNALHRHWMAVPISRFFLFILLTHTDVENSVLDRGVRTTLDIVTRPR